MRHRSRSAPLAAACACIAVLTVASLLAVVEPARAEDSTAAAGAPGYSPPVDGRIVDGFRAPSSPYGPGNRGVDYATVPGQLVVAAADGVVTFAGQVGGSRHVVILHADGIRTSYSFLAHVLVRRGQRVAAHDPVGIAAATVHWGARAGTAYLDPRLLLSGPPLVHLVASDRADAGEADERDALARFLAGLGRTAGAVGAGAVAWAGSGAGATADLVEALAALPADELQATLDQMRALGAPFAAALAAVAATWEALHRACTPASAPSPRLQGRRVAVLVAGLGSSSEASGLAGLALDRLGYGPDDQVTYSYRGGSVRDRLYGPEDTTIDLRLAGDRLRALLDRVEAANPGVPIDVIAHSQGGLVARWALRRGDRRVAHLVTLATPHHGTDLASARAALAARRGGTRVIGAMDDSGLLPVPIDGPALDQLSERSRFVRQLDEVGPPPGIPTTSIAARGDWFVPAPRSRLAGATNVIVSVAGLWSDHGDLPASSQAARETALAVADLPPTCEGVLEAVADQLVPELTSYLEGVVADRVAGTPPPA